MHLTAEQQEAYLQLLGRGASPAGACQQLGIAVTAVYRTLEADPAFRQRVAQIDELLSRNVAAALYRAAMEGDVAAQKFWLDHSPPAAWIKDKSEPPPLDELLRNLSDHELLELDRALEVNVPNPRASALPDAADADLAGDVP